ncbi:MAG: S9 family peptidase [bacterium]|nr:S9 family peptidase [bacterium]
MTTFFSRAIFLFVLLSAVGAMATESAPAGYQMPTQVLADIIDAPQTPWVLVSPDNEWLVFVGRPGLPSIEEVAQPELRLAGLRINPRINGRSRQVYGNSVKFQRLDDGKERQVTGLPEGARLNGFSWSDDGKRIAFVVTLSDRISLWTAELKSGKARQATPETMSLNGVYGRPYSWLDDGNKLVVRAIVSDRGQVPVEPLVPEGPVIQENLGKKAPARTHQDLLKNKFDESLYEYYATSQAYILERKGKAKKLGEPALFRRMASSPGGDFILTEKVKKPYSYSLQENKFPRLIEVIDRDGELVYEVANLPLQDQIPISFGSVAKGRRSINWRSDAKATLYWAEALDGGDGGVEAEERDRVFTLEAPFEGPPEELTILAQRYGGVTWGNDNLAFVSSWWWKTRNVKIWQIQPGDRSIAPKLIEDRSWQDRYNDPGTPVMHPGPYGAPVMLTANNGQTIFLSGDGASPEGDRPFLDSANLKTGDKKRLFHSEAPYYERFVQLVDAKKQHIITRRESQKEPPNYYLRDLKKDKLTALTTFPDPAPQLAGLSKELITYKRADGVDLTGTLYLPPGYDKDRDGSLPVIMWAYPTEFKSKKDAGQVTDSPYRFTRVGWYSPMLYLTLGYAVLDDPTMPIIGEGDVESNDSFVEQLVMSAQAAVDAVVERGVGDKDRMAIGGHSYGAFMAANLLAHSDLFRLGLPRSGAYNRSLTPFGFQAEERTIWEAPEVYFAMSPFMHADKIDEPILIVHGDADNNSGTYPMQSERLYGALKGLGATARLVMLPHESHSYRARESVMHVLWETSTWLDRYVMNAKPRLLEEGEVTGP